jgi:hypothetical protein
MRAVPYDPFFPGRDVPDVLAELLEQPYSGSGVSELQQPHLKLLDAQKNRFFHERVAFNVACRFLFFHFILLKKIYAENVGCSGTVENG